MTLTQRPIGSTSLHVALDMTFSKRNEGGSGVYSRSLFQALHRSTPIHVHEISASDAIGTLGTLKWLSLGVRHTLREGEFDLLHCPAVVMPAHSPLPVVVTIFDASAFRFKADFPFEWQLYNILVLPLLARRASFVITASEFAKRDLVRYYRLAPERIKVTYLAPPPHFKPPPPERVREYRSRLGSEGPLLLFAGAPIKRKNLDAVLRVLAEAPQGSVLATARLAISGVREDAWPSYRDWIAAHGLEGRVLWLGQVPQEEMALLYASVDVLVYPSLYEGFGLPPLEAMSAGTPVIASNASCLPEVLGRGAIMIDPHIDADISHAIESVLTRPDLRARLVEAGFAQARKYSWDRCAQETADIYRAAVAGQNTPRTGA